MTNKLSKALVAISLGALLASPAVLAKQDKDHKDLPPGLQKKAARGEPLPPGWQKRYHRGDILDNDIYARGRVVVPLGNDGLITVDIEGTLFKLHDKTRMIIEILEH